MKIIANINIGLLGTFVISGYNLLIIKCVIIKTVKKMKIKNENCIKLTSPFIIGAIYHSNDKD